jgi:signal transduction histidine kinase
VTDLAAPRVSAPRPARNSARIYRLGIHLVVQALVAAVCVALLRSPPPSPPPSYRLVNAQVSQSGAERKVALPDRWRKPSTPDDPAVYALTFDATDVAPGHPWSVFLPRFMDRLELAVNGAAIFDSSRDPQANRPNRNTPELVIVPASLLRDGANTLTIRLFAWGPLGGFLDQVYAGPDDELRPAYERRTLLFVTAPVIFSAWQAGLAAIVGIIWLKRRHESYYGVFAAAMLLGFMQAFGSVSPTPAPHAGWNTALIASGALESVCVVLFVVTFLGFSWPKWAWFAFVPGLLILASGFLGYPGAVYKAFLVLALPTVGLCLVASWLTIARAALRRFDLVPLLLACGVTVVFTCWVHDMLTVLDLTADRIFVSRLSYSALLIAIGIGLTWRFANALNEVDGFARRTVTLLREAEARLRVTFANEERLARAAALAAERTRLMRDLHDGLGGQLVSIVALSERKSQESLHENHPVNDSIGDAARAALRDLRLVVDAMDDIDGDLMLALGVWRERAQAQLRPHGMALEWRALTPSGLPVCPDLRPWHVIQILRLLDEAVTNAVKHSGAKRVTVSLATVEDAGRQHGRITISDNGRGFCLPQNAKPGAASTGHRGLANMAMRAARCGAALDLKSGEAGTRVQLDLPSQFPATEDAAG